MRARNLSLVFLLSSTVIFGQQQPAKKSADSALFTYTPSDRTNCPIGVDASLSGTPSSIGAGASFNGKPVGQQDSKPERQVLQLHLDVSNPSSRDIVAAKFTVHGFSRKLRAFDLSDPSNKPDVWKTIDVALDVQGKGHSSSDVSLTHFNAIVTSIDLDSVVYADGTPWLAPSTGACSITPNPAIRIASAQ
jgi:hypothetical protein